MSESSEPFVGYVDGASRSTQNLSSATWAIFTPNDELVSFEGSFIGRSMNNIAEYSALIEPLFDAISFGINFISIRLHSQYYHLYCQKPNATSYFPKSSTFGKTF